ncbi:MAG: hypothetical protein JWN98_1841 [Abditibacteriota bacterium]|nr:hypothetical protein [Abditibacteriota bacterium]
MAAFSIRLDSMARRSRPEFPMKSSIALDAIRDADPMSGAPLLRSLYICYFPITEPLVQTQVVAYLAGLAARGHTIHLLTFETEPLTPQQQRQWRQKLREQKITWHHRRYHKRPTVPATAYDVLCGALAGLKIIRRHGLEAVHARAHVPAAMGLLLKKLTGCRLIFDIRGLWAEEYEDAGIWTRDSLPFRVTKATEAACIRAADGIVVLTERVQKVLFPQAAANRTEAGGCTALQVIPCCADLSQIEDQAAEREAMRQALHLDGKTVMVYVGKFGGWYMQAEMVDFFADAKTIIPDLHFLVLTQSEPELIATEFARRNVPQSDFTITRSAPNRVGAYLAASDFAISFIAAFPSKIASSPTKLGEYLAAGLPVVCNPGVGDVDLIVERYQIGATIPEFEALHYRDAAAQMSELVGDAAVAARCRQAAHSTTSLQETGVPRYHQLYSDVAAARSLAQQS